MTKQKQVMSRSYLVVMTAGLITTCLGFLIMVGWYSHNLALIQALPPIPYMRYNTALAFFLSGLALVALARGRYKLARWLGIVVGAIGFLTLIQYVFEINLGIDQLLMKDYLSPTAPKSGSRNAINYSSQFLIKINKPFPGRPAPNTAFSFTLMGTALFLLSRAKKRRKNSLISGIFGVIIGAMGVIALLGYLSGVVAAYSWGYSLGLALYTALGLIVLSVGIMTLGLSNEWHQQIRRPPLTRGIFQRTVAILNPLNWLIEQKTIAGLSLAAVVLIGTNVFSYWGFVNYKETSSALVADNRQVLGKIDAILSKLKDAETGQRGYIITGREEYLEPYNQANKNIYQQLGELRALTPSNPNFAIHNSLISQKLAELNETIELRRNTGFAAAQQVVKTDRGKIIMDRIRVLSEEMKQQENERLKQSLEQSRENIGTQNLLSIGIVLTLCLFYWVYYILQQENIRRQHIEQALRQSEQRWRVLYEALPVGVVLIDPNDASFVDFNDAAASNLDYTQEEFARLTIAEIDISLNREEILQVLHTFSEQSEGMEFETQHRTKNGEIRDIRVRGKRLILENRILIYGVWFDITEQQAVIKEREEAILNLQHSEQRYRSLLTATTQIIWTTNAQGEVIEDFPGWREITGQSAEDMKGWGWLSVLHPDDQAAY